MSVGNGNSPRQYLKLALLHVFKLIVARTLACHYLCADVIYACVASYGNAAPQCFKRDIIFVKEAFIAYDVNRYDLRQIIAVYDVVNVERYFDFDSPRQYLIRAFDNSYFIVVYLFYARSCVHKTAAIALTCQHLISLILRYVAILHRSKLIGI